MIFQRGRRPLSPTAATVLAVAALVAGALAVGAPARAAAAGSAGTDAGGETGTAGGLGGFASPASSSPGTATGAASAPPRVLLVIDAADDPFARRLAAELGALGLSVLTLEPWRTGTAASTTLEGAARAENAVAAIRTVPSRKGVEIWMADQVTGRPLLRQLVVDENPGGPNQSLIALQTVELLRTSLFPKRAPDPAPPAPPPVVIREPAPPPAPPPAAAPPEMGVTAGVGGLYSPGGTSTAVQVWLSLHRTIGRRNRRLEVDLDLSAPARSASLSAAEGSTTVQTYLAGLALLARQDFPSVGVVLDAGLGGGALVVSSQGSATPPFAGRRDATVTGMAYARVDAAVEAARWLRVGARGVAGLAFQDAAIRFVDDKVGSWGKPFAAALATIEVCWR